MSETIALATRSIVVAAIAAVALAASSTNAALIDDINANYVKAELANTANAAGGDQASWFAPGPSIADNRWSFVSVTDQGYGATALAKVGSWHEQVPTIVTAITGLNSANSYDVYVLFDKIYIGSNCNIAAGLTTGSLVAYTAANSTRISGAGTVYYASLGNVAAGLTSIPVYVGDFQTFGEGVEYLGVSAVPVPEPASLALLGLSGIILLRRNRRR